MVGINEQTSAYLSVTMKDKDEAEAAPDSATYKIHDKDSGDEIRASTPLLAQAVQEITLTAEDNTIVDSSKARETRIVTIEAVYGASDELNSSYKYYVRNLSQVA